MTSDSTAGIDHWVAETSAFDRVRSVAFALQRPRTAGEIAESAHVAEKTARGHLQRLVEMDLLLETGEATPVTYYPDPAYMRYREVRTLARDHDREELVDLASTLKADIAAWREQFGVDTPDDLRASVARTDVAADETPERQRAAEDWEFTEYRLGLVEDALAEYERLTARPPASA